MALKYITKLGNQLQARFDDGSTTLAYPVGANLWYAAGSGGTPPDPDPDGKFILPFGYETVWPYNEFRTAERPTHDGIDFGPGLGISGGEGIAASNAATVEFGGWGGDWFGSPGFGNLVVLNHGMVGGNLLWTLYAHMVSLPLVTTGDTVVQAQTLGYVGETGNAFGKHLHWETWVNEAPINPRDFMTTYGRA